MFQLLRLSFSLQEFLTEIFLESKATHKCKSSFSHFDVNSRFLKVSTNFEVCETIYVLDSTESSSHTVPFEEIKANLRCYASHFIQK